MFFLEYLRISCTENTSREQAPGHEGPGCAHPLGAPPASWAHGGSPPLIPAPTHFFFLPKNHYPAQARVLAHFAAISLLKATLTKLLGEIVPWYVTPPLVQLVFVLVLYSLQILAALVTLFLYLHVKFMRFQVILMHDIGSRHL